MYNPCKCGHDYDRHAYSTQAPCTVDGCACRTFDPDAEAERRMIVELIAKDRRGGKPPDAPDAVGVMERDAGLAK
jgi:hypothetical protein